MVIETKRPEEKGGVKQAESYARNLGADYHVWSNGSSTRFFRTARYIGQSAAIGNVPRWLGEQPVAVKPPKTLQLPPFRDEEHLRAVVKACHDQIFHRLGHDPAKAFDELMKILFLKLFDERETPQYYDCVVLADDPPRVTAGRIRKLFERSTKSRRYRDVFTTRFTGNNPPSIDLDDETITFIVKHFQGYSIVNTSATLEGADVKGTVFEKMVGGTFRGELGAYFTPREIVSFMVQMASPTIDDVVLDPACGSGGFFIMTLKYVLDKMRSDSPNLSDADVYALLREFAQRNVFGTDIKRAHGACHEDEYDHAWRRPWWRSSSSRTRCGLQKDSVVRPGDVTCIFSNPPFAGREEDPIQLAKFSTTKSSDGEILETPKSIPFVEHIIDLLAEGGKGALVLPSGIFNSQSRQFSLLREKIWRQTEILAIVGLPHWVFFHTGCDVQGALLFVKRTETPRDDYDVHIDWAEHVGYDASGRKTTRNDFPAILSRFARRPEENQFRASKLRERGRIDPLYFQRGEHERVSVKRESDAALTDVLVPTAEFVKKQRGNRTKVQYVQVGDTDAGTGAILSSTEYLVCDLPARAKYIVRENMLLVPNHRNSIKAGRSVVLVPRRWDGGVVTSRFIAVRSKIPAVYLYYVLNLDIVKEKMLRLVSGSSSTEIKFDQLSEIRVPLPKTGDFDLFLETLHEQRSEVDRLRRRLNEREEELEGIFRSLYA